MKFCPGVVFALVAGGMLLPPLRDARADDSICAAGEVLHKVAPGDTIGRIAAHYYCVDGDRSAQPIAQWLEDHNGAAIGEDRARLYPGTLLCLPAQFRGATWIAKRCWPEVPVASPTDACVATTAVSDKPVPEKEPPATVDERHAEPIQPLRPTPDTGEKRRDKPSLPRKKEKLVRRISAELLGGAFVPFSAAKRGDFYQALGHVGVGGRITLGVIEIAPRVMFVGSGQDTTYNDEPDQAQSLLGGGATAQFGVAIQRGAWRFTPGIEGGWLGVRRSITQTQYPHEGEVATNLVGLSVVGVFFRPEYQFGSVSRVSVAVEIGSDVVSYYRAGGELDMNVNGRISGGVGYAF